MLVRRSTGDQLTVGGHPSDGTEGQLPRHTLKPRLEHAETCEIGVRVEGHGTVSVGAELELCTPLDPPPAAPTAPRRARPGGPSRVGGVGRRRGAAPRPPRRRRGSPWCVWYRHAASFRSMILNRRGHPDRIPMDLTNALTSEDRFSNVVLFNASKIVFAVVHHPAPAGNGARSAVPWNVASTASAPCLLRRPYFFRQRSTTCALPGWSAIATRAPA